MPRSMIHTLPTVPCRASIVSTICLHGRGVMGVAGEHFVAQREAIEGDHQSDAHLLAVGTVIARVAALGLRIGGRLAFEVGRGDVVEQHFVVDREQLADAFGQMRLERRFMRQQLIERAIQPVLVDQRLV